MKTNLPLKNILKLSCCFCLAVSFFLFLASFMEGENLNGALIKTINAALLIVLISIGNIALLIGLDKKDPAQSRKYTKRFYLASIIWSIMVILGIYLINNYLAKQNIIRPPAPLKAKGNMLYMYLALQGMLLDGIILLWQNYIIVQDANNKAKLENSRLNAARSEAATQLLLQQIHPHFLFNALNILKSLIKRNPEKAEDYLVRLSDFLRASVSGNKSGVATLQDEIKLCTDYLEMQKVRFGDALSFSFSLQDAENSRKVLPVFSLQPLLENVIKHNELTEAAPLNISIDQQNDWISVVNNIQLKAATEDSTGSGLANLAERYSLLSGDEIEIKDDGHSFSVRLKILNHEDCNH
jgi:two-component system LytT family sensor kinase